MGSKGKTGHWIDSVLIVDHEEDDLFITQRMLTLLNIAGNIFTAGSVFSALEIIKSNQKIPELIIVDLIKNKKLCGFLKQLKSLNGNAFECCRIVVLSAHIDFYEKDVEEASKYGNMLFVAKPIDSAKIEKVLIAAGVPATFSVEDNNNS